MECQLLAQIVIKKSFLGGVRWIYVYVNYKRVKRDVQHFETDNYCQ